MSESEFLSIIKSHLTKAVITIVLTFIGSLILTVYTVRSNTLKITNLQETKADRTLVNSQFNAVDHQLETIERNIKTGQDLIIQLLREK